MSDTPRTDLQVQVGISQGHDGYVHASFARELERELAKANEKLRLLEADVQGVTNGNLKWDDMLGWIHKEKVPTLATLRAQNAALASIVDAADLATTAECTCGGNADNDSRACPACKIYHRIQAAKRAAATP